MTHVDKFSKAASSYEDNAFLQENIIKELLTLSDYSNISSILDLGCGTGLVYKNLNKKVNFIALDASSEMCSLHPNVNEIINESFDNFNSYKDKNFELIIAASSLHWSENISSLLKNLLSLNKKYLFAIFLDDSFHEIREVTGKPPQLPPESVILENIDSLNYYIKEYPLTFENKKDLFDYLKNTGVGGKTNLTYKETIHLLRNFKGLTITAKVMFIYS